jgi:recombination protein RecA
MLVRSNAVDCVVVDSVAALVPKAELEGEMGQSHVGLQARMMSQALRKLTGVIAKSKCIVIFINQLREKIGVMFGNPETTPGGRALKFYSSIRIDIRRVTTIKEGDVAVGNHVRAKVVKNKVAAPFKTAEFDIMFNGGISTEGDLIDMASQDGIVEKTGAWFSYGQVRLGQGRENAKQFIAENPELIEEIRAKVLAKRGFGPGAKSAADAKPRADDKASGPGPVGAAEKSQAKGRKGSK